MPKTTIDRSGILGYEVVVDGLDVVRNALETTSPKVRRKLDAQMKETVATVAGAAARQVDSRTGTTAAGYKVSRREDRYKIQNRTRGAAILEFAAIPHCPQGASLVGTLSEKYGQPGRILWDSWDAMAPFVVDRITQLVEDARLELDQALG